MISEIFRWIEVKNHWRESQNFHYNGTGSTMNSSQANR